MSQNVSKIGEQVKESICRFYLDNKTDCDFNFSEAESIDIEKIYEKVADKNTIQNLFSQVALVILTANKYEKNILHYNLFALSCEKIKMFEINLFSRGDSKEETYAYWFRWEGYTILHIEAQKTGSYTIGGSADIVRYVKKNKYLYPMGIISLGICFGTNENDFSLGDVIISKKIYPYFIGAKIKEEGYFVDDDNMFKVNSKLSARIKSILDRNLFSKVQCNVFFGNYITGEAVISSKKARDQFVKTTKQQIMGGEMEGYGLFKECNGANYAIPCLTVKSICDWAVMKNFDAKDVFERICDKNVIVNIKEQETIKDRIQAYASYLAFCVVSILLQDHIFDFSLYDKIIEHIKSMHGKAVYANHIKTIGQKIAHESICDLHISDEFIIEIVKNLIKCRLIFCDNNDFNCILSNDTEEIWKCSFSINKEV